MIQQTNLFELLKPFKYDEQGIFQLIKYEQQDQFLDEHIRQQDRIYKYFPHQYQSLIIAKIKRINKNKLQYYFQYQEKEIVLNSIHELTKIKEVQSNKFYQFNIGLQLPILQQLGEDIQNNIGYITFKFLEFGLVLDLFPNFSSLFVTRIHDELKLILLPSYCFISKYCSQLGQNYQKDQSINQYCLSIFQTMQSQFIMNLHNTFFQMPHLKNERFQQNYIEHLKEFSRKDRQGLLQRGSKLSDIKETLDYFGDEQNQIEFLRFQDLDITFTIKSRMNLIKRNTILSYLTLKCNFKDMISQVKELMIKEDKIINNKEKEESNEQMEQILNEFLKVLEKKDQNNDQNECEVTQLDLDFYNLKQELKIDHNQLLNDLKQKLELRKDDQLKINQGEIKKNNKKYEYNLTIILKQIKNLAFDLSIIYDKEKNSLIVNIVDDQLQITNDKYDLMFKLINELNWKIKVMKFTLKSENGKVLLRIQSIKYHGIEIKIIEGLVNMIDQQIMAYYILRDYIKENSSNQSKLKQIDRIVDEIEWYQKQYLQESKQIFRTIIENDNDKWISYFY